MAGADLTYTDPTAAAERVAAAQEAYAQTAEGQALQAELQRERLMKLLPFGLAIGAFFLLRDRF